MSEEYEWNEITMEPICPNCGKDLKYNALKNSNYCECGFEKKE